MKKKEKNNNNKAVAVRAATRKCVHRTAADSVRLASVAGRAQKLDCDHQLTFQTRALQTATTPEQ